MGGDDSPREECGVFGVRTAADEAAGVTYNALLTLQHRGQEGAGIAVMRGNSILYHKDMGLVGEVFTAAELKSMPHAHAAVGHVRYSTTGGNCRPNTQPMVVEYLRGRLAAVHNGNIVNAPAIRQKLRDAGCSFAAQSDSEVIASLIAFEALKWGDLEQAVELAGRQLRGSFSLVVLGDGERIIALRDACGFRPLCVGVGEGCAAAASESCALESVGIPFLRDLAPGEMAVIEADGSIRFIQALTPQREGMCAFEYIYFARTDSVLDKLPVYDARLEMGRILAREHPVDADAVCGVPDSGLEAAMGFAAESGIPYVPGFVKNRYVGRSFIFPSQAQRDAAVRVKLSPLASAVRGRRVVVVDDSIVRGTTSAQIVSRLRAAGAREVHFRVSSPPFRHECHFGTDIDSVGNLIANRLSFEETARYIGADSLGYLSAAGLRQACAGCCLGLCMGCFDGDYPVDPAGHTKNQLEGCDPI